jgi:hypothetical protein
VLQKIGEAFMRLSTLFFPDGEQLRGRQAEDDARLVGLALRQYQDAKLRFEQISDPDLIDPAIFEIVAAERKYISLLKKARDEREAAKPRLTATAGFENNSVGKE